jgi:hypothetical protein
MSSLIYSDNMATYIGASKTFVAATGSPYSPLTSGRLVQLRLYLYGSAVTALIEGFEVKLNCALWGVDTRIFGSGAGLRTAPAFPIPASVMNVDLPVKDASKIQIEVRNVTADTPVTVEATLIGVFEA